MGIKYQPLFTEHSKKDYIKLDKSQRLQILKSLKKIKISGMNAGQALHGKLSDCRKMKHKKLGLRVVFRQSEQGMEIIEIVIVGKREDAEAYKEAIKRLSR